MAFDTTTRNRLNKFVAEARRVLTEEFSEQLQSLYGISASGGIAPLERLTHLDAEGLELAATLRQRIAYLTSSSPAAGDATKPAIKRLTREQAFTVLNRLAAIRMAEKRGLIVESVGQQYQSKGFKVFESVAGSAIGDTYDRYRCYLFCLFDELAIDLGSLFDRRSPQALLFPRETSLLALLTLLDDADIQDLWAEDETIGWIYQYYNDPAERKKMREESAAPRNRRELAVRNQFFTPRYVVEFLTDNTLGRIWYEMTQGGTTLKEQCRYLVRRPTEIFLKPGETAPEQPTQDGLSQEDLLKQPVFIAHRSLKDPRSILMLDPACGSMHFGLYAFDLFEAIYDEAWNIAAGSDNAAKSGEAFSPFCTLAASFADKAAFLQEVPRMIVEHNLHGIDIDPRAAQIAGLSLWLRAQRAWHAAGVKPVDRPRITRSNIVCAEPMPGDKVLLAEFVEQQFPEGERAAFGFLLETVFDRMTLAGEAGSLLKIEEEIRTAIAEAKKIWEKEPAFNQRMLFGGENAAAATQKKLDLSGITDEQFWEGAEERIYDALRDYAEQAETGGFQRRLFAEDAARGFAFIDVCRKRYDVVVMNPPFGDPASATTLCLQKLYVAPKHDIASAFIERAIEILGPNGRAGCITTRTIFFLSYLAEWRQEVVLRRAKPLLFCDCGYGVLDATVESALAVISPDTSHSKESCFFRTIMQDTREQDLVFARNAIATGVLGSGVFLCDTTTFKEIPRAPFAYWVSDDIRRLFSSLPRFESDGRVGVIGALCQDDFRFVRAFWEFDPALTARNWTGGTSKRWVVYSNGGSHTPVFAVPLLCVNWAEDGSEVKAFLSSYRRSKGFSDQWTSQLNAYDRYFRAALTWSSRPNAQGSFWILAEGGIFGNSGPAVFCSSREQFLWTLGIMNSQVFRALLGLLMPRGTTGEQTLKYELGYVRSVPMPLPSQPDEADVPSLVSHVWDALRQVSAFDETSQWFVCALTVDWPRQSETDNDLRAVVEQAARTLTDSFDQIDRIAERAFTLSHADRENLLRHSNVEPVSRNMKLNAVLRLAEDAPWPNRLTSYAVGIVFGRWDIRYSTVERPALASPDPFAPLPVCPPGMLQGEDGLPVSSEAGRRLRDERLYPVDIAWDGILVDDPNHVFDIERRVREVIEIIWTGKEGGPTAEAIEVEACEILGVKTLRDYFRKPANFFADHLKRYSKSRRQAPIYWPLSTKSGSYTLWIYYHRLNNQTLHKCLADFLDPKIKDVENELGKLAAKDSGRAADLRDFLNELKDLKDEIERVIKLPWKPNFNDGVLITASPLWKLFRLSKWQKDLKACWEELAKGDYDWAHLAYTIWPERVEKVCEKDRSIAIAHGLEHLCKIEPPKPKKPRGKKASS